MRPKGFRSGLIAAIAVVAVWCALYVTINMGGAASTGGTIEVSANTAGNVAKLESMLAKSIASCKAASNRVAELEGKLAANRDSERQLTSRPLAPLPLLLFAKKEEKRRWDRVGGGNIEARGAAVKRAVARAKGVKNEVLALREEAVGRNAKTQCSGGLLLTFDDGINEETAVMLDALQELQMQAMFFPYARTLEENFMKATATTVRARQAVMRRIVDEGHVLGCHGYFHKDNKKMTDAEFVSNLELCGTTFSTAVSGFSCKYYRAPFGSITVAQREALHKRGVVYVPWDVDTGDWYNRGHGGKDMTTMLAKKIKQKVLREKRKKYIMLMHNKQWNLKGGSQLILTTIKKAVMGRPAGCIANPKTYFQPTN